MEIEIGAIVLEDEIEIGAIEMDIQKVYPELEDLEITPTSIEQNFKSEKYGYDNVKVKAVASDTLNITPSKEEQQHIGLYGTVNVIGDENLSSENIREGINLFGIDGKYIGDKSDEDGLLDGSLTDTYINNRITELRDYAFYYSHLKYFYSNSIKKIKTYVFSNSKNLETVLLPNMTQGDTSFRGCTNLKHVDIHNATGSSGITNFGDCPNLPELKARWTTINGNCFLNCTSLTTLILTYKGGVCTLASTNAFTNSGIANGTGYIYVPKALIEKYKVATNWINYANQFRAIEDYPEICGEVE